MNKIIVDNPRAFDRYLDYYINRYRNRMDRDIGLSDFNFVTVDPEKHTGYYSYKGDGFEICIEEDKGNWNAYLCNNKEEVLEEKEFDTKAKAISQANKFHKDLSSTM